MKRVVRALVALLGAAAVVVSGAIMALMSLGLPSDDQADRLTGSSEPAATQSAASDLRPLVSGPGSPAATPLSRSVGVDVARLIVPSLEIDAPIVTLGVDPDGTMQSPDSPEDVAWYSFSGRPNEGSNIVLAGHLDFLNYGPAVFYNLRAAEAGAELQLELVDGTKAVYRVLDVTEYEEATAPVQDIVGASESEIVTLITCGGSFDASSREYDRRVVLRAERVPDLAQGSN